MKETYGRELWFGFINHEDRDSLLINDGCTSVLLTLGNEISPNLFNSYERYREQNRDTVAQLILATIVSKRTPYAVFMNNQLDSFIKKMEIGKFNKYRFIFVKHGRYTACYKLENSNTVYKYINSGRNDIESFRAAIDILLSNNKESFLFNESRLEIFYNSEFNLKDDFLDKFLNDKGTLKASDYSTLDISDISFDKEIIEDFYFNLCNEYLLTA
jgi:hypothetical protein